MGNASLLDMYGSDNMDLLIGLKQDGNVENQGEILKRLVERNSPRIISREEFSIPGRWELYTPNLPGYVYHKNFGVVLVMAKRIVNVPQTVKPEYPLYAVCPVKALIDPLRNYVDTRLPQYTEPVVLYEVSEFVVFGNFQYELFRFKQRIIYRLVYDNDNPSNSSVELADIEDQKRSGWGIETTLGALLQSTDVKDRAAVEMFVRTYPNWAIQMDFMRIFTRVLAANPISNYLPSATPIRASSPPELEEVSDDGPRIYQDGSKNGIDFGKIDEENQQQLIEKSIQSISKTPRLGLKYRKHHLSRVLSRM